MKSAHVYRVGETNNLDVRIENVPVPSPNPGELLIKVVVAGTNPKDWKAPLRNPKISGTNTGDDVAGFVVALGPDVTGFHVGDRVAALHKAYTTGGAFAEYAIVLANMALHLPEGVSFEEGATIPLCALTAVVAIFGRLGLPAPWDTNESLQGRKDATRGGVLVYGAASAVGSYAVKLLQKSNIHPIICVAGRGIGFVEGLLNKSIGDAVVDYRQTEETLIQDIKAALPKNGRLMYALDTVSESPSYLNITKVLDPSGNLSVVLTGRDYSGIPETVNRTLTTVGSVYGMPDDLSDLGYAWMRLFEKGLKDGWFSGHPHEVVPGGLAGVQTALDNLKDGKASALKYVCRIAETEGLAQARGA